MNSSATYRVEVWNGLLDAARYHRYNAAMKDLLQRRSNALKFSLALLGLATSGLSVISFSAETAQYLPFAGLVITALIVWDLLANYSRRYTVHELLCPHYKRIADEYKALWARIEIGAVEASEVNKKLKKLELELHNLYGIAADGPINEKINKRCTEEAYEAEAASYVE